ncbi:MAG: hypothetical protein NPIRA04_05350 [Nitrospirales bacterium]|nr:MAG: hypothetical protein NPIRA04_05350 [Nitrospirales bacterium]
MVPPWVPDIPLPTVPPEGEPPDSGQDDDGEQASPLRTEPRQPIPIAPVGRFGSARRALGDYARTGDRDRMRQGIGRYVQSGYGGSATATRRFGGTAQTANMLHSALSSGGANPYAAPGRQLDPVLLAGRSADEVMDAVVEAVRPVDGTQDTEASRTAIKDALSEVLTRFPEADLLDLQEQHREFVIERYIAVDVFRRFDLDLGKTIRDKAPNATSGLGRLKEIREYIRETVAASFRRLRDSRQRIVVGRITQIVQCALRETFQVFEAYAE